MRLFHILPSCIYAFLLFVMGEAACPLNCYCSNKVVECSANMEGEFPVFPPDTEKVHLSQLNVRYIPVKAFTDLPNIKTIHITNSNIAEFQSCSISDLNNLTKIIIDKSAIGNIESYAFKNLKNIEEIRLENCRIGRIKPFAFYDIENITMWNMINVHMRNVYTEAFYGVSDIENMVFHKNNFSDVVTGTFKYLTNVKNFEFHENKFWNLQCRNLDDLMNAGTEKFYFGENTFYCNCSVSWLLNDVARAKYGTLLQLNFCHGPESITREFGKHNLSAIGFSNLNCQRLTKSSDAECKGVEKLIPNLKCPQPGQPSLDVVAIHEEEKRKNNDKNSARKIQLTNYLIVVGFIGMLSLR